MILLQCLYVIITITQKNKMKITLTSKKMPSFTGFWTKWIATSGKVKVEARTAHKALTEIIKLIK